MQIFRKTWQLACLLTLGGILLSSVSAFAGDKKTDNKKTVEKKKDDKKNDEKKVDEKKKDDKTKDEKKKATSAPLLSKAEALTDDDEKDTIPPLAKSPRKVYKLKLTEGKIYQIDLKSDDFDAVLRLEDAGGRQVAVNDDFERDSLNSRIVFAVSKSGEFKIIATCLDAKPGKFALTVVEAPSGTTVSIFKGKGMELQAKDGKASFAGELSDKDAVANKHYFKLFTVKLEAGKTYRIDQRSDDFDAFLFLEDPLGNVLAQDDDSGGGLNSRIVYKATTTGNYRIIATSLKDQETGKFTLEVVPNADKEKEKAKPKFDTRLLRSGGQGVRGPAASASEWFGLPPSLALAAGPLSSCYFTAGASFISASQSSDRACQASHIGPL